MIKIIMMPLVIGGVTIASKKWGNLVGGMIASMPWIAGPIMLFFTFEQGVNFAVDSVKGIMIGVIGVLAFCFAYIYSAVKSKWHISLLLAYLAFIGTTILLKTLENLMNLDLWFLLVVILSLLGIKVFPHLETQSASGQNLKYDIYLRMIIITVFVTLITYLAKILGPTWSGILTPFPIITAILAAFTHYTQGAYGTSIILRGILTGFIGFASFLYLQAQLLPHFSIAMAFAIGFIVNILLNLLMQYLVKRFV
ncbi:MULTISPECIES: hypothetical protein [Emticicia]|uniref:hypothetical protein n=1 Tax=Emticicia TaxID=312278 RepID=UPI001E3F2198|nr:MULTISPECIES: hypothetical protein [Emticicia]